MSSWFTCIISVFENKDKIILVMECADGGELYDYINNNQLTEKDARRVFRQIVSAIKHCHQVHIHSNLMILEILIMIYIDYTCIYINIKSGLRRLEYASSISLMLCFENKTIRGVIALSCFYIAPLVMHIKNMPQWQVFARIYLLMHVFFSINVYLLAPFLIEIYI
jgi:serine/threonine protein kinase